MPPENWTERRKRVWTPDHDGHCMAFKLCYYYEQAGWCLALGRHFARDGEDRSARPRRAPDRTDSSRAHTFLFLLYTDRGWLLWYRLYSTDRIGSFFSSWSSSSLSLMSSHACCICRPWMCWVPTSYCLLFSSSHYLGGKRKVNLEKKMNKSNINQSTCKLALLLQLYTKQIWVVETRSTSTMCTHIINHVSFSTHLNISYNARLPVSVSQAGRQALESVASDTRVIS